MKNAKTQITNNKQITMTEIPNYLFLILFEIWKLYFGIWHYFRRAGKPSYETSRGRNSEKVERRTSNAQHRTLNIEDATLYRFYNKRTAEH